MLIGLRGGGGNLGVVVELEVKAYPLQQYHVGDAFFDTTDAVTTIKTVFANLSRMVKEKRLPRYAVVNPMLWPVPGLGLTLICSVLWSGPHDDEFQNFINDVTSLGPAHPALPTLKDSLVTMTPLGLVRKLHTMLAPRVYGHSTTVSLSELTPEFIDQFALCAAKIPRDCIGGVAFHGLSALSPSCSPDAPSSVCPYTEPLFVVEMIGHGANEGAGRTASAWARDSFEKLASVEGTSTKTYTPLTAPDLTNVEAIYGQKLRLLKELKNEYDPTGVFKNAVPMVV
jgi:hypothetical protein